MTVVMKQVFSMDDITRARYRAQVESMTIKQIEKALAFREIFFSDAVDIMEAVLESKRAARRRK